MELLEEAYKEAISGYKISDIIYETLEIHHNDFRDENNNRTALRVVRGYKDLRARLEQGARLNGGEYVDFIAYPFELKLPSQDEKLNVNFVLTIDNVDKVISEKLAIASSSDSKVEGVYRNYIESDLEKPQQANPIKFFIVEATVDLKRVVAKGVFSFNLQNKSFPSKVYNPTDFPGLVR